jgi:uncharacterized protein (TIGR02246 family)
MHLARMAVTLWIASAAVAAAQDFHTLTGTHPLLVTVDDLPIGAGRLHPDPKDRERLTRDLLAALAKHDIHAVAFVIWGHVQSEDDRKLLDLWRAAGHELGNHTFSHLDYPRTERADYLADVEKGRAGLQEFLDTRGNGAKVRFFRFPYLREGDTQEKLEGVREQLKKTGQRTIPVTLDNEDWSFEEPWVKAQQAGDKATLARLAEDYQSSLRLETLLHTADGDALFERPTPQVLLVHVNAVGAAQWDALFTWLEGRGYQFASADEVMADPAIAEAPAFVGRYGGSHWGRVRHLRRQQKARDQIAALLEHQAADWNKGDLEAFCSVYADDAAFVSPKGVSHGRGEILARYRQRYPDGKAMGTLRLEVLELRDVWGPEITSLGDAVPGAVHGASVIAKWTLEREGQPAATGHTLLVLHRRGDAWRIVQDASM